MQKYFVIFYKMSSFKTNISPGMKRIVQILSVLFACSAIFLWNAFADEPAENPAESGSDSTVSSSAVSTGQTTLTKAKPWTAYLNDYRISTTHTAGHETPEYKQNIIKQNTFC